MNKIIVYCDVNFEQKSLENVSYEIISKAYDLIKDINENLSDDMKYVIEAVALCDEISPQYIKKAFQAGAGRFVLIKDKSLENFSQCVFSKCFCEYFNQNPSPIILFGATQIGRIVAPRITTILNTGLVADCTGLDIAYEEGKIKLLATRPTFGSELMATILSKTNPQCATIRPKTFIAKFDKDIAGQLFEFHPTSYEETRIKFLRRILDNSSDAVDFSNAKIVLSGGFGLNDGKDKKYFLRLEQLANLVGAKVGASRKVVDFGLMPQSAQIGQTGSTTTADVYVAFGISGAIQHICGMKNCKTIIAINTDENAEIFKYADYKIVEDAKALIDDMLATFI